MHHRALIVFMKYPEPGAVKTRLAREVGAGRAAHIYAMLLRRTLGVAADCARGAGGVRVFLFFAPHDRAASVRKAFPGPWRFVPQDSGHIGMRMGAAFARVFSLGFREAVLIGTDIADITLRDIRDGFSALGEQDCVLGPAGDGGFYLIGLKRPFHEPFSFDSWSHPGVFERTASCFYTAGLTVRRGRTRRDVDTAEDAAVMGGVPMFSSRMAVIVPFVGREPDLAPFLSALEAQVWPEDEIILVRGVMKDALPPAGLLHQRSARRDDDRPGVLRLSPRTRLVLSPRGRGIQLNMGVRESEADLLWFLHADSRPPANFGYVVRTLLEHPHAALGCFRLSFGDDAAPLIRLIARWANVRTRYLGLPYGDQSLFCRRRVFEDAGGFRMPFIMEDVDFVERCRRVGGLMIAPDFLVSSPRRYREKGALRVGIHNHVLMLLYRLGVENERLYEIYYGRPARR